MKAKRILFTVMAIIGCAVMCSAQSKDEVTLVVSGDGVNKEEATKVALRSAIEQAYGTFVSANTSIVNDELIKDEIVTVASGNIKSYEEISSEYLSDGKSAVTLRATVSISKLISYAQTKGASTEFAGAAFAMSMKMYELNKKNEIAAFKHLWEKVAALMPYALKRELVVGEPAVYNQDYYKMTFDVVFKPTEVMTQINEMILKTMEALSLSKEERANLKTRNILCYPLPISLGLVNYRGARGGFRRVIGGKSYTYYTYYFRNNYNVCFRGYEGARVFLLPFQELFEREVCNWEIVDNTGQISSFEYMEVEDLTPYKKKDKNYNEYVDIDSFDKALRFNGIRKKYPVLYNPTGLLSVSYGRDFKMCAYLEMFGYQHNDWIYQKMDYYDIRGLENEERFCFYLIDPKMDWIDVVDPEDRGVDVADVARWHIHIPKDEISKYSSFEVRRKGAPLPALIQSQDVEGAKAAE